MAKGIPTSLEARIYTKTGSLPGGATTTQVLSNDTGGSENFAIVSSADGVNPFMVSVYNSSTVTMYLASSSPSTTTATGNAKIGTVTSGAANTYWFGAGWYVVLQGAGATTMNLTTQGATVTNPQNA